MREKIILGALALLGAGAVVWSIVLSGTAKNRNEHAGHEHDAYSAHEEGRPGTRARATRVVEDEGHEEKRGHGERRRVELTPQERERIELEIATAGPGTIVVEATFPGEIVLNPDRVVHVVPRAAGIVRDVTKTVGDSVEAGEPLAWSESEELAEAKLSYYAKRTELGCCMIKLPRAKEIFENTSKLLTLLKKEASQEELHKLDGLEMGKYRGRLLAAYAEFLAAREVYEREKRLRSKKITRGQELLEAEKAFKKAREEFHAAMDTARYETLIAYGEAIQERLVAEFEAVAAEKRLRLKGADDEVVAKLLKLVPRTSNLKPCACEDPNCEEGVIPSVAEVLGSDKRFAWYAMRAPFAGVVIEKHITLGELVETNESVFSIADTSSVWVHFNVYQKDLALVKSGQSVRVTFGPTKYRKGKVTYVSPIVDERTRSTQARVVLDNRDGSLRPGLYVTVRVAAQAQDAAVVIPQSAIQVLNEKEVVFVEKNNGFEAVPVQLGAADSERVIITSGLRSGQRYVVRGAFDLKAKIVTSALSGHAGHGH